MFHKNLQKASELDKRLDNLMKEYEAKGNNPDRKKLIRFIQSFKSSNREVILGACVYVLETIKNEKGLHLFGSHLTHLLKIMLEITKENPLDDQKALTYFTEFYHHLRKFPRHINGESARDKESEDLVADVEKYINILLTQISKKRPSYCSLIKNMNRIPQEYKALGGLDSERDKRALFLQLLDDHLLTNINVNLLEDNPEYPYIIRYGALLYIMEQIEIEYKYICYPGGSRYNKGSALFKACRNALNIEKTSEVSLSFKKLCYSRLLNYMQAMSLRGSALDCWKKIPDAAKFLADLTDEISKSVYKANQYNSVTASYIDALASAAIGYGVTIAMGNAAESAARAVTTHTIQTLTLTLLNPGAAALIGLMLSPVKSFATQHATDVTRAIIIATAGPPVVIIIKNAKRCAEFCREFFGVSKEEVSMEVADDTAFLKALASLPDHLFVQDLKTKMKYIVNYDESEPAPVKQVSSMSLRA